LLVRPDGYIAWRHTVAVHDDETAVELLRAALDAVLGRTNSLDTATTADLITDVVAL